MTIRRFEDIRSWQKAQDLAVLVYQNFGNSKDFGFKDQICRAAVSISNNIAEGFDRGYDKDFVRMLRIAKGSCSEVKSMLYLANRLDLLHESANPPLITDCEDISKLIQGLINAIK